MTKIEVPAADTTLLQLLGMGARITFGSQRYLSGDLASRYIAMGNEFSGIGVWDLDARDGVDQAVNDLIRDAAENGLDLHGGELPHPDDANEMAEEVESDVG